jgi:DNA processing protein
MDDKAWWLALHLVPGVGRITFKRLVEYFGHPRHVMQAPTRQLMRVPGIGPKIAQAISGFQTAKAVEWELRAVQFAGCQIVTQDEESYPALLKAIDDPPPVLYVRGDLGAPIPLGIAMVGSRQPSTYGKVVAEQLARGLAESGVTVVSGLARGIDSVSCMYPPENRRLAERISHHGAVVSEFPMATKPDRLNFPLRNRTISGISLGTVVVEAGERSGALITAQWALEQGREVFAVPGNVTAPTSRGANRLIKMGAKLVESVEDILEELPQYALQAQRQRMPAQGELCQADSTPDERHLLEVLDPVEARHIDWIIEQVHFPTSLVSSVLLRLELAGKVTQLPGKLFVKVLR